MKKGIDVSYHQGKIDWKKVKASGIEFAILREGYRKTIDTRFLENVKGCQEAGIPILGVYHFIYAMTDDDAAAETQSCLRNVEKAGLPKTTIIFSDFEYDTITKAQKAGVKLTREHCNRFTHIFCESFKACAYPTGIYCNVDYYTNMYDRDLLNRHRMWIADYSGKKHPNAIIQQYTSKGVVPGISSEVDLNYLYDDTVEDPDKTELAMKWMEDTAVDDLHGYDQIFRWGEKGDYDCSAAVITAWENAGVPVKAAGATYTGNMVEAFKKCGFTDVTASVNMKTGVGLQRGDVLLAAGKHTAMYCGNGQEVEASINEKGTAKGGQPGDQTGREFLIRSYRNYPWTNVFRYSGVKAVAHEKVAPAALKNSSIARQYRTITDLNIRYSPAGTLISTLPCNTLCRCYGYYTRRADTDWYLVAANGITGYVSSKYLKRV